MSAYYPPKIVVRPAPSAAGADLRCRRCHNALVGLNSDAQCPKCGLSVAISMRGAEIRYSDPAWIRRLHRGAVLVLLGTFVLLLGAALGGAMEVNPMIDPRLHVPADVILAGCLLYAIGNWLLTTADPSRLGEKSYGRSRKISRIAWILGIVGAGSLIGGAIQRPSMTLHFEFLLGVEACDVIALISAVAMLDYLSKLAVRMRDARISERAHALRNGTVAVGVLLMVTIAAKDFVLPTRWAIDNDLAGLILSFQAIAGLSGLVLWMLWILLLMKLGKRLKEQVRVARTMWETPV